VTVVKDVLLALFAVALVPLAALAIGLPIAAVVRMVIAAAQRL
jgi:hypothetical protein